MARDSFLLYTRSWKPDHVGASTTRLRREGLITCECESVIQIFAIDTR
jgi:hypothetical protein